MARPRHDGTPARAVNKRKLTDLFVSTRQAEGRPELIWDLKAAGSRAFGQNDRQAVVEDHLSISRPAALAASWRR